MNESIKDTTYGVALAVAESLKEKDTATINLIHETMEAPAIVISTLQLALLTLRTIPKGKWVTPNTEDIRDLAEAEFDQNVSNYPKQYAELFSCDPEDFHAAVTTIVMASLVPLMEGDYVPTVDMETEMLTEQQIVGCFAVIALSCLDAFNTYSQLMEPITESGKVGADYLRTFLPQQVS